MYIFLKLNIIIILLNYHYYYKSYLVNYEHLYTLRQRAEYISHMWGSTFNWGAALLHLRLNHRSYVWKEVISDMVFVPAQKLPVLHTYYSGTQLIRSLIGQKNLAVLTRVFLQENLWRVLPGGRKKVAVITRWPHYTTTTFKRSFSKKMGKKPSSHIIHLLGGECCWIVQDSEPIRLLKSPRSLSVYILMWDSLSIQKICTPFLTAKPS